MQRQPPLEVKIWGDFACFTRPEMKAERASYPAPTPSAARGVLEAIFWKPQFRWRVKEIWVLKPIRYLSILRNEVQSKASDRSALQWRHKGGGYFAANDRAQRNSFILRDVAYLIFADVDVKPGVEENPAKFRDQFRRRVQRGQFYHCPYLGCREFAAGFGPREESDRPEPIDEDLGSMLFDLAYRHDENGIGLGGEPIFFDAKLKRGVLKVPQELYDRMEGSHAPATVS